MTDLSYLTESEELKLGVGETERKMLRFKVPDELYGEDGVCELEVTAYVNGEADLSAGETLALGGTYYKKQ
ncbi:MAG: hypothetical protein K6B54_03135 [Clostridia bacterium]|nr:hypothetical protein [Clostridia bacterium]